jgi:IclR family transcriptional regulator, acetate operon repressor
MQVQQDATGAKRGRTRRSLAPMGLELATTLARHPEGLGISDLARSADVEVAQMHRILADLVRTGWIAQARPSGAYRLTGAILSLAAEQLRHSDLRNVSLRAMRRLRRETGETVVLAELRDGGLFCIAHELAEAPLMAWTQIGERWAIGSPAAVAIAVESAVLGSRQEELLPRGYRLDDERQAVLDETVTRGWSYDEGLYVEGACAVGAAILDLESRPLGALAIGWPRDRAEEASIERLGRLVRAAADEISAQLGSSFGSSADPWRIIAQEHEEDLFRHLADLRDRSYEGAVGREASVDRYRAACALLSPVVTEVMTVISDRLLGGKGRIGYAETGSDEEGLSADWTLRWPEQEAALLKQTDRPLEPVTVVGRLRPAHIHGHLGGSYFGDWPMQITTPADARRQAPIVLSIIEAEIHQRVFEAGGAWNLIPAYCEVVGEPTLATSKEVADTTR